MNLIKNSMGMFEKFIRPEQEANSNESEKIGGEFIEDEAEVFSKEAKSKKAKKFAAIGLFISSAIITSSCATGGYSIESWTSPARVSSRVYTDSYKNERRDLIDRDVRNEYERKRQEGRDAFYADLQKGAMSYLPSCRGNEELVCGPWCVGYAEAACQYKYQKEQENRNRMMERGRRDAQRDFFEQQQQIRNNKYRNYNRR